MNKKDNVRSEFIVKKAIESPIGRLLFALLLWAIAGGVVYWLTAFSDLQLAKDVAVTISKKLNAELGSTIGALGMVLAAISVSIRPAPAREIGSSLVSRILGNTAYLIGKIAGDFLIIAFSGLSFVTGWFVSILYFKDSLNLSEIAISTFGFFVLGIMLIGTGFLSLIAQMAYREHKYFSWVDQTPHFVRMGVCVAFSTLMYILTPIVNA